MSHSELARAAAVCALACLTLGVAGAQAATIPVDIETDTVAADGHCSLREAITAANDDVAPFMGAGECPGGSVSDLVTLPAGHFVLSRTGASPSDDTNVLGDLDVLGAGLTIRGQGAGSTAIDANRIDRVIDVLAGRSLTLESLTVTGGQAPNGADGDNATGSPGMTGAGEDGGAGAPGGGIRNAGTLTITDSTVSDNNAGDGGDGGIGHGGDGTTASTGTDGGLGSGGTTPFDSGGFGGGIYTTGALTLTRVTVTGNSAGDGGHGGSGTGGQGGGGTAGSGGHGGTGIGGKGGRGGWGGGIAAPGGATLTIDQSTISGNRAGDGGDGGFAQGGAGGVANGTTGGNGAFANSELGGGLGGFGGGIYAADPVTLTRSLVTENRTGAGGDGGDATGGLAGPAISGTTAGGNGGFANAGSGASAGAGGGVYATGEFENVTIQGNDLGDGGAGGDGKGGKGGNASGGAAGGDGGGGSAGDGGSGGSGGGYSPSGSAKTTIRHATITTNGVGTGAPAGVATGGAGGTGSPAGDDGTASPGLAGSSGGAGGLLGSVMLANSVVAGNATPNCGSGIGDGGHNFTFPAGSCPGTVADPLLAALADNGGPTRTEALLPGSPLIDAVPPGPDCAGTDQRGIARPQGPACDAGAFEVEVPGPPGQGDTDPPEFLSASIRPKTFAVNRRGAREAPVAARVRKGTTVRFSLSEDARVVFTVQRAKPGRRVKRRCVKPNRSNRRRPRCTRFVRTGRFAAAGKTGANTKKFSGRIGRRALKPGRYRAVLLATDAAGNKSAPKRLSFRVVRR